MLSTCSNSKTRARSTKGEREGGDAPEDAGRMAMGKFAVVGDEFRCATVSGCSP